MFENIVERVLNGSRLVILNVPEEDYFISYHDITRDAAEEIVDMYFQMKGKDGIPRVTEIGMDKSTHSVKIVVEVELDREMHLNTPSYPDVLNTTRNNTRRED